MIKIKHSKKDYESLSDPPEYDSVINTDNTTPLQVILLIFFGIILSFIIIEILLDINGSIYLSNKEYQNNLGIKDNNSIVVLALGESTTAIREYKTGTYTSWTLDLEEILNNKSSPLKFRVINEALPNTYTGVIANHLSFLLNKYHPDIVITMMGVNDFKHGVLNKILNTFHLTFVSKFKTFLLLIWIIEPYIENLEIGSDESVEITKGNYRYISQLLKKENITFIAMNYPTLKADILVNLLGNNSKIKFINNENNFKEALSKYNYTQLFLDEFGSIYKNNLFNGNFGHTTSLGDRLIAENVADNIMFFLNISD